MEETVFFFVVVINSIYLLFLTVEDRLSSPQGLKTNFLSAVKMQKFAFIHFKVGLGGQKQFLVTFNDSTLAL